MCLKLHWKKKDSIYQVKRNTTDREEMFGIIKWPLTSRIYKGILQLNNIFFKKSVEKQAKFLSWQCTEFNKEKYTVYKQQIIFYCKYALYFPYSYYMYVLGCLCLIWHFNEKMLNFIRNSKYKLEQWKQITIKCYLH